MLTLDLSATRALEQARENLYSLARSIADGLPGLVGDPGSGYKLVQSAKTCVQLVMAFR